MAEYIEREALLKVLRGSAAARKYKTQPVHINECCEGRRKTAGGVHWESMPLTKPPEVEL